MTDKRCTQTHTHTIIHRHRSHNTIPHTSHTTHIRYCSAISYTCCSSKHTPNAHTHTPCTSHLGMCIHTQMHSQHPHPRPVTYTQHPSATHWSLRSYSLLTPPLCSTRNTPRLSLRMAEGAESRQEPVSVAFSECGYPPHLWEWGCGGQARGTE